MIRLISLLMMAAVISSSRAMPPQMLSDSSGRLGHGMVAWFNPTVSGNVIMSSTNIACIRDATGHNNYLTNAAASDGGTVEVINSLNTVTFNGDNQYLKCPSFTLNQPCSYSIVGKLITWTDGKRIMDGDTTSSAVVLADTTTPAIAANAGTGSPRIGTLTLGSIGIMATTFNGASSSIQYGFGTTNVSLGSGNPSGFTLASPGGVHSPTYNCNLTMCEGWLFNRVVYGQEVQYLQRVTCAKFRQPGFATVQTGVVFDGDSRSANTYETGCLTNSALASTLINPTIIAVSGQTVSDMITRGPSFADSALSIYNFNNIVVILGGRNDAVAGADAATIWSRLSTYCAARKAAGFKVIICTEIDAQTTGDNSVGWHSTIRPALDALIQANWSSVAYLLCDLYAEPQLQDANDTTYFVDKVHLTATGYSIISTNVARAIASAR